MTDHGGARRRRFAVAFGLVVLFGIAGPAPVAAATDRLPDLRSAYINDFHIVQSGGRRLLRFTGMMYNTGAGPLEIRARRASRSSPWHVDQIVYDSAGGSRRIATSASMKYAGDGHDHWHVRQMLTYHLWGSRGTLRDAKIGFCFFDTNLLQPDLPRSPAKRVYAQSMCGKRASLTTRNGISVGWGDKYPWNFAYQWIDITGLPAGAYTIRSAVDLYGQFKEPDDKNNCSWARIQISASGKSVKQLSRGKGCINDTTASPFAADIAWARETGVSSGCDADMFCTNNPITRSATAAFISRALKYPAATKDYFTDDNGDPNQAYINRLAAAGVTKGCSPGRFCPASRITREQVAALLARALALPAATTDYFDDDDGTRFEADINRIAAAGISTGCGPRTFCPTANVTRGQLAAMLHRAIVPPAA